MTATVNPDTHPGAGSAAGTRPAEPATLPAVVGPHDGLTVAERAELTGVTPNEVAYQDALVLGGQIVAGAAKVARTTAAWVAMLGEFDARQGVLFLQMPTTAKWLEWACSMNPTTAREHVRVAQALRDMPHLAQAFADGEVSYSKVRACTRIAGLIDDAELVEHARNLTAAQLERAVRGYRAGRTSRLIAEKQRSVSFLDHADGTVKLTAWLSAEEAAIISGALETARTRYETQVAAARAQTENQPALPETSTETGSDGDADARIDTGRGWADASARQTADAGSTDTNAGPAADTAPDAVAGEEPEAPAYTRADALVDIARGFIDAGPADVSGEDRDLVVVHIDAADLHAATGCPHAPRPAAAPNVSAETASETAASPSTASATTEGDVDSTANAWPRNGRADASAETSDDGDAGVSTDPRGGAWAGSDHSSPVSSSGLDPLASGAGWIEAASAVPASTAARIACNGIIQPIVIDTDGEVLYLGRERRLASKQQKRALKARDQHCQFPGCLRNARLHAHHITAWSLGGPTDIDNMLLLCRHHHVIVHAASITITKKRSGRGYTFTRVGGQQITAEQPDQYSKPGSMCGNHLGFHDTQLLNEAISDAQTLDPTPVTEHEPDQLPGQGWDAGIHSDFQLPDDMSDLADLTDFYDPRGSVLPRWGGERVTAGTLWELMEHNAATPRTNHNAGY